MAIPPRVRSEGRLALGFRRRGARTVLYDSFQSGCLRARMPRSGGAGSSAEQASVVLMNTAGGLAEGDRLTQDFHWGEGASACVTTQAAEKVYRALASGCRIETQLTAERGACVEWLPQETILFDQARLRRDCRVLLAEDVSFLGVESVVLGRSAMGEVVRAGLLRDTMRIYRNDRLVYADALHLEGDIEQLMRRAAIGDGARAMAVIVHAADTAEAMLEPVRAALDGGAAGLAAASSWNGLLAVRLLARDGADLRRDVMTALGALRGGRDLPRSWSC